MNYIEVTKFLESFVIRELPFSFNMHDNLVRLKNSEVLNLAFER
jgi:hypothetical protein